MVSCPVPAYSDGWTGWTVLASDSAYQMKESSEGNNVAYER
jgi:hypothetical protein